MPTSFDALHEQTRPLALLAPAPSRPGIAVAGLLGLALLIAVPLALVVLV